MAKLALSCEDELVWLEEGTELIIPCIHLENKTIQWLIKFLMNKIVLT